MLFAGPAPGFGFGYIQPPQASQPPQVTNVRRLQYALRNLAAFAADPSLSVVPDGKLGPRTRAAVNRALETYAESAPPAFRTGRLTSLQIVRNVGTIAPALEELAPL
jgi:hypothetical protein